MGRYYNTASGREGKFMFGVQSSDDPEYMGMYEEPTYIQYYASKDEEPKIRAKLDEQYDLLGVPKDKRLYTYKDYKEYDEYERKELSERVWIDVREDDKEELAKHKNEVRWASNKKGYVSFERKNLALVLARIRLGATILSDIKDDGYCSLEAET